MTRKRLPLPIALFVIVALLAGCGGGAGSPSTPSGVNPSVPSIVQLLAVQQIVQTNSSTSVRAKVLDGNGAPIAGVPVIFTNLSLLGVLSSTTATTNSLGYATVSLYSTDPGFATIQAEVNTGSGKVRDRKVVFFSLFDMFLPPTAALVPTLDLAVDSNNNGIYSEPADFYLSTGEAIVRATVMDETGSPVLGDAVKFGSDSTELTFPDGAVKTTNPDGQAFARVKVVPSEIRNFDTPVNVTAVSSATGAGNVITLFLTPIEIAKLNLFANPLVVASAGTSALTATATTSAGTFVQDGTTVNFSITSGSGTVTPFGQTTAGVATATYTAPTLLAGQGNQSATIVASSGGTFSQPVTISVTAPALALTVTPASRTVVSQGTTQTVNFTITGGTGPYTTTSSDPTKVYNTTVNNGTWSGSSIAATVAASACPASVSLTISDSAGASKTVAVVITSAMPLSVVPNSGVCPTGALPGTTCFTVTVSGGVPFATGNKYSAVSNDVGLLVPQYVAGPPVIFNMVRGVGSILLSTSAQVKITDACGTSQTVDVMVNP